MKSRRFAALICGYGVPKDVATDPNYMAYLHPAVNYLFSRYGNAAGTIVVNGGATDLFKPYKRTEAGEITAWLKQHISKNTRSGRKCNWRIVARPKSLTTVENLMNFAATIAAARGLPHESLAKCGGAAYDKTLIFCEATRAPRIRRLIRAIAELCRARVVAIDFDASPRRCDLDATAKSERSFLRLELATIRDPATLARLRRFAMDKLRLMRRYAPEEAHRRLPQILTQLHTEYQKEKSELMVGARRAGTRRNAGRNHPRPHR